MATKQNDQDRIVRIPGLVGGKPVIKGTRIPVDLILERLTYDLDLKTLFEDYPDLTEEDIKACIAYGLSVVFVRKNTMCRITAVIRPLHAQMSVPMVGLLAFPGPFHCRGEKAL